MIVRLNRDWRFQSDPHQWIVQRRLRGAKAERHQWKSQA